MPLLRPARPARRVTVPATVMSVVVLGLALFVGSAGSAATVGDRRPGAWDWPLQPRPAVVRSFEAPLGTYGPGHRGIDLAAAVGAPVRAVAPGEVTFAGQVGGRPVVVVDHGRLRTTYEPVLRLVRRGAAVSAGEVVGAVVLPGSHCLPLACLHLGVRDGDIYLDPLGFLPARPVRLLPVQPSGRPVLSVPVVSPLLML